MSWSLVGVKGLKIGELELEFVPQVNKKHKEEQLLFFLS